MMVSKVLDESVEGLGHLGSAGSSLNKPAVEFQQFHRWFCNASYELEYLFTLSIDLCSNLDSCSSDGVIEPKSLYRVNTRVD